MHPTYRKQKYIIRHRLCSRSRCLLQGDRALLLYSRLPDPLFPCLFYAGPRDSRQRRVRSRGC